MRKLVYDCYTKKGEKAVLTASYEVANRWKTEARGNYYVTRLINVETIETKEEKEKRLERIAKKNKAREEKRVKVAAVG